VREIGQNNYIVQFCPLIFSIHLRAHRMVLLIYNLIFQKITACSEFETLSPYKFRLRTWEIKVLLSKFHCRTNLMALLFSNLGFRNQMMRRLKFRILRHKIYICHMYTKSNYERLNLEFYESVCLVYESVWSKKYYYSKRLISIVSIRHCCNLKKIKTFISFRG
jgi:hypothetical protein